MTIATYGLIGHPLAHSFSPQYFEHKFEQLNLKAIYKLFPIKEASSIAQILITESELLGLNVTTPHKVDIIPFLDKVDAIALKVNAVNCIHISNNKLIGHNTDVIGFEESLKPLLLSQHTKALILGTGGAAKAVIYVLEKLNISYQLVSRKKEGENLLYEDLDEKAIDNHKLIINTTPLGMHPKIIECPSIPYQYLSKEHLLYDLIYNPEETKFLSYGKKQGATIKNGLQMLELQAEASWKIWNS